jgi:hypothetical protein
MQSTSCPSFKVGFTSLIANMPISFFHFAPISYEALETLTLACGSAAVRGSPFLSTAGAAHCIIVSPHPATHAIAAAIVALLPDLIQVLATNPPSYILKHNPQPRQQPSLSPNICLHFDSSS